MSNAPKQILLLYKKMYDRLSLQCPGDIMTLIVKILH